MYLLMSDDYFVKKQKRSCDDLFVKLLFLNVKIMPNKSCLCHPRFIVNLLLSTWVGIKGLYYALFINE